MKNEFKVTGDTTIIFCVRKGERYEVTISTEDLEKVSDIRGSWWVKQHEHTSYAWARIRGRVVSMHRLILDAPDGMEVDHENHNTRGNIRVVTKSTNMQNLKQSRKNNKSGVVGVYWNKKKNKWKAEITINGVRTFIGYFDDIDEAKEKVSKTRKQLTMFKSREE